MKGDPRFQSVIEIPVDNARFQSWFADLRGQVEQNRLDRRPWVEKVKRFHARRYAVDKRKPSFPFPGAADVWPPLTDMVIEQMKSLYLNILLLASPPCSVEAFTEEDEYRTADIETHMEYLMNYRIPGFMKEASYFVDDQLSEGFGRLKAFYHYSTTTAPETISLRTLPSEIAERVVREDVPAGMETLFFNERAFDAIVNQPQIFNGQMHPSTRTLLQSKYDLDPQDPTDAEALELIIQWLRAGARQPLTFKKRDVVIDTPAITSILGENFICPSYADDVEDCYDITHEFWLNEFQVRSRWRDAAWSDGAAKELIANGKGKDDPRFVEAGIRQIESQRQGMSYTNAGRYALRETCSWYDYNEDQVDERVVVLWSQSALTPLKCYAYQSPTQRWPYFLSPFERNKRGIWNARGIPERLQDIERELVVAKRAELNRKMISASLSLLVRQGSPVANQAIRWVPGEKLIVQDVNNDIKPLMIPDLSVIFQRDEQIWKTWAEGSIGTPNYSITDPLSQPNEPRTAKEIGAIQSQGRAIGITRTSIFRETMSGVFQEIFNLWQQFGPDEVFIATSGGSPPIKMTQEDLQGGYRFVLAPLVGMDDPQVEAAKAMAVINLLMTIQASGTMPPDKVIDIAAATEAWLRKTDPRLARKVLRRRTPEEMQQMAIQQQQQSQMAGTILGSQAAQGKASVGDLVGGGSPNGGSRIPGQAIPPGYSP